MECPKLFKDNIILTKFSKSVYLPARTVVGARLWTVKAGRSEAFSTPNLHVSSLNVIFLPFDPPPCLILLLMEPSNHCLETSHIVSFRLVNRSGNLFVPI